MESERYVSFIADYSGLISLCYCVMFFNLISRGVLCLFYIP